MIRKKSDFLKDITDFNVYVDNKSLYEKNIEVEIKKNTSIFLLAGLFFSIKNYLSSLYEVRNCYVYIENSTIGKRFKIDSNDLKDITDIFNRYEDKDMKIMYIYDCFDVKKLNKNVSDFLNYHKERRYV